MGIPKKSQWKLTVPAMIKLPPEDPAIIRAHRDIMREDAKIIEMNKDQSIEYLQGMNRAIDEYCNKYKEVYPREYMVNCWLIAKKKAEEVKNGG